MARDPNLDRFKLDPPQQWALDAACAIEEHEQDEEWTPSYRESVARLIETHFRVAFVNGRVRLPPTP